MRTGSYHKREGSSLNFFKIEVDENLETPLMRNENRTSLFGNLLLNDPAPGPRRTPYTGGQDTSTTDSTKKKKVSSPRRAKPVTEREGR